MNIIAFVFTALSIIGTVANSFKKRWCFYVWSCTNIFWCCYNASNGMWAQALLYVFNFSTCIIGLYKWKSSKDIYRCDDCCSGISETDVLTTEKTEVKEYARPSKNNAGLSENFVTVLMWRLSVAPSRLRHLAYNVGSFRTRKKNRVRLEREYRKHIKRKFQGQRAGGGTV